MLPFSAIVGMRLSKKALLLLAVDAGLKGVLLSGGAGTAKSLLIRAFRDLLAVEGGRPFVDVPPGVTEDRLLGGLDLERTLAAGRRHALPGLLAAAHGGYLVVEGVHRLEGRLAASVADALNHGSVRLERDGISMSLPADIALVGSYDPDEGAPSAALTDAVGLHVRETGGMSREERLRLLADLARFDRDPEAFANAYATRTAACRRRIAEARGRLERIAIEIEDQRLLSEAALALGLGGHRGEILAARAARAHAALAGRNAVAPEDLESALRLVLLPRSAASVRSLEGPARMPDRSPEGPPHEEEGTAPGEQAEDLFVAQAIGGKISEDLLALLNHTDSGSGLGRRRSRPEKANPNRGRYVFAVPGGRGNHKVAIEATLRAAAPHQIHRRHGQTSVRLVASDLRFKQFKQKAGMLVIFAVDASGSMALSRIDQAKGTLMRLLRESYLHRDRVALISFRGERAEIVLPPSRATERARRSLEALGVGGGTPLAAGLRTALELASRAGGRALLVLMTDGRPNVASRAQPATHQAMWQELGEVSAALRLKGVVSVVIDTRSPWLPEGQGARLAGLLGGRYVVLPRADSDAVYRAVIDAAPRERS